MSVRTERPGVYSTYDALRVVSGGSAGKTIGVVAASSAAANTQALIHSYAEGVEIFGATGGMADVLRALYQNGAGAVRAVSAAANGYAAALALLEEAEDVAILVCDSTVASVHALLAQSAAAASGAQRERIAVLGAAEGETVSQLVSRAENLNSERAVLVGGKTGDGMLAAAALAAVIASADDPSVPVYGAALRGTDDMGRFADAEIDTLVRGGVSPVETAGGETSAVRAVTTRTTTGGARDTTWRELTTILIVDDVIPTVRNALRARFARSKNTAQSRGAVRAQVVMELEEKRKSEIIEDFGGVTVSADAEDPTVCLVTFSFTVAHAMTRIYLTAHISV